MLARGPAVRLIDFQETELGGDDLSLLLAIDRIGRKPQQAFVVGDDDENDERRHEDDIEIRIDDLLRWCSQDEKWPHRKFQQLIKAWH